jgi:hypothetical protein
MEVRTLDLSLSGFGAKATTAVVAINILTSAERLKRAALTFGAGLVAALIALPIPLVHFVFVPGALAAGTVLSIIRLRQQEIFRSARGACPYCGKQQGFTLMGPVKLPRKLHCEACHRELMLEGSTT